MISVQHFPGDTGFGVGVHMKTRALIGECYSKAGQARQARMCPNRTLKISDPFGYLVYHT